MALTATAQSALPREPTWDEVIVPALRKRLKDESTLLSKRISAASITSIEEQAAQYYAARPGTSTSSHSHSKKSAIPRPSLQSSRTADSSTGTHTGAHLPPSQRARALSQPYPFFPTASADSPPLFDTAARPISPINAPKGTRIPISRGRTGSTSSQAQSTYNGNAGRANGTVGYPRNNGEPQDSQLWPVEEKMQAASQTSRSTVRLPRHQVSDIFQEQAPFHPNTSSQGHFDYGRQTPDRMSSDSEEHPFEHWYRGDVARNGGVGELRVARRQEMLDIANYGHTLRKASGKLSNGAVSSRSRSNSRGREMAIANGRQRIRTRADSVGARESIFIDEDEMVTETVMDERPLTDLESDGCEDQLDVYHPQAVQPHPNGSISSPSLDRSETPTSRMTQNTTRSRIPQPAQRSRTTTPTPGKPIRSASESGMSGPSSSSPSSKVPRSASQPKSQVQPEDSQSGSNPSTPTKRRGKSPAGAASASASKKAKSKAPPSSMRKGAREDGNRRSVGQYPTPEGDEDAIPTWTQPVPANGNWDDVVLPVVARKKGLQDQYETADGSPKPKGPEAAIIEPAPGTFGFDATTYRKRYSGNPEQIPMDEFGQKSDTLVQEVVAPHPSPLPTTPVSVNRKSSPPPFSAYVPAVLQPEVSPRQQRNPQVESDDNSGASCCKCVIM